MIRASPQTGRHPTTSRRVRLCGQLPWHRLPGTSWRTGCSTTSTSSRPRSCAGSSAASAKSEFEDVVEPEKARLRAFCAEIGLEIIDDDGTCPLLAAPLGMDATHASVDECEDPMDHERLVCLDLTGNTSTRVTVMTTPGADPACVDGVAAAIAASGRKVTLIKDSPGFVGQRMVAMIGNLGCYMAEIGLASPEDIDTAMQLGLNYPRGSISLVEELGVDECLDILTMLQSITGEDRYRPTLWLKRRAILGCRSTRRTEGDADALEKQARGLELGRLRPG